MLAQDFLETNINVKINKIKSFNTINELLNKIKNTIIILQEIQNDKIQNINIIKEIQQINETPQETSKKIKRKKKVTQDFDELINNQLGDERFIDNTHLNFIKPNKQIDLLLKKGEWNGVEGLLKKGIINPYINAWHMMRTFVLRSDHLDDQSVDLNFDFEQHIQKYCPRIKSDEKFFYEKYIKEWINSIKKLYEFGIIIKFSQIYGWGLYLTKSIEKNLSVSGLDVLLDTFKENEINTLCNTLISFENKPGVLIGLISLINHNPGANHLEGYIMPEKDNDPRIKAFKLKVDKNKIDQEKQIFADYGEKYFDKNIIKEQKRIIKTNKGENVIYYGMEGLLALGIIDKYINAWHIFRYYLSIDKKNFEIREYLNKYYQGISAYTNEDSLFYGTIFQKWKTELNKLNVKGFEVKNGEYGFGIFAKYNKTIKPNEIIDITGLGIPFIEFGQELDSICNTIITDSDDRRCVLIGIVSLLNHNKTSNLLLLQKGRDLSYDDSSIYMLKNEGNTSIILEPGQELFINYGKNYDEFE
jgi:hypothetical protein